MVGLHPSLIIDQRAFGVRICCETMPKNLDEKNENSSSFFFGGGLGGGEKVTHSPQLT